MTILESRWKSTARRECGRVHNEVIQPRRQLQLWPHGAGVDLRSAGGGHPKPSALEDAATGRKPQLEKAKLAIRQLESVQEQQSILNWKDAASTSVDEVRRNDRSAQCDRREQQRRSSHTPVPAAERAMAARSKRSSVCTVGRSRIPAANVPRETPSATSAARRDTTARSADRSASTNPASKPHSSTRRLRKGRKQRGTLTSGLGRKR